jgi:hypothetical protein
MAKNNGKLRRAQAELRNEKFAAKNPEEIRLHLDLLLGKNKGARKQRLGLMN